MGDSVKAMNDNEKFVLITGARGQLGYDLVKELKSRNIKYLATEKLSSDIKFGIDNDNNGESQIISESKSLEDKDLK